MNLSILISHICVCVCVCVCVCFFFYSWQNDAEDYEFALFASKGFCFVWSYNSKYCLGILVIVQ